MTGAGKFNKRFDIERPVSGSPAVNSLGEPNIIWDRLATVWGAVEPINGREFWAQQQVQSEITVKIKIRYRSDVATGMRIVYRGDIYIIKSVIDPQEYHQELQLMCSEGVRNG
jgi:SPP1 family predicted phage head-tail adaptor